ncbi:MAG: LPS assembly protein LptD [Acidobacteriota bacterium]
MQERDRPDPGNHPALWRLTALAVVLVFSIMVLFQPLLAQERPRVEYPYGQEKFVLTADRIESLASGNIVAEGNVEATYADSRLTAPKITFNPETDLAVVDGPLELTRGHSWLRAKRAEIHVKAETGVLFDVYGFTDEQLFVRVKKLIKTGPRTYIAEDGYLTSCEGAIPKWSFRIQKATINLDSMAHLRNTLFRVKNIPLFYFPYLLVPTEKKERSTGFLLPTVGSSSNKGRRLTNRFYVVLGRSADVELDQDYYSKRGYGSSFTFRARPNEVSRLDLTGKIVDDRLGQGGSSLEGVGYTRFGDGFRAVADFSLVSNFRFRQTFAESFFTATRPTEASHLFLTNNSGMRSFNIDISREETLATRRNIVTQATPSIQFRLLGQRIGTSPLFVDLESSVGAMSRSDALIETPQVTQRLDLFPRVYFSLPLFQGLRVTPSLGVRETYYSNSLSFGGAEEAVTGESLQRQYADFSLELNGWGLSRIFGKPGGRQWKHLIEPEVNFRWITGIDNFHDIIRYDAQDAIADTRQVEFSLVNRFFVRDSEEGYGREWLSVRIGQLYFFEPTMGGALVDGEVNQFFPLDALTGLPYAIGPRDFSPVTTVVRFTPDPRASFDVRADYDPGNGDFRSLSATGFWRRGSFTAATTYFLTEPLTDQIGRSHQIQGRVSVGRLDRGLSGLGHFSYDAVSSRLLNYLARVNYFWNCCGVSVEVGGFNLTTRQERQVRFSFFLKGIGSFGNIRRPDMVF